MKFSEIANRLTGISTPLGGVSWQSSDLEVSAARRVIAFLEDRRVLYAPEEMEVASHCVQSVLEIRRVPKTIRVPQSFAHFANDWVLDGRRLIPSGHSWTETWGQTECSHAP
jgi:hypothetical protein